MIIVTNCAVCGEQFEIDSSEDEDKCQICRIFYGPFYKAEWTRELTIAGLTYSDWFVIVGHIQLAIRHPENTGPAADYVRSLARQVAQRILENMPGFSDEMLRKLKWDTELGLTLQKEEMIESTRH